MNIYFWILVIIYALSLGVSLSDATKENGKPILFLSKLIVTSIIITLLYLSSK